MANRTWKGGAAAVAQIWSGTVTDITVGHTYIVTLTDEAGGTAQVSYTVVSGDTTTTLLATHIVAGLQASTDPRFTAVTWSSNTNVITGTAIAAGVPFYIAVSGTGTWASTGNTTKNSGPNDWNTAANWVENVVPIATDNVTLTGSNAWKYGLQTGLALGAFNVVQTASVQSGSQGLRASFTCTSFYFAGSGLSYFDLGSSAIAPRVVNTASASAPACGLYIKGSALTTVTVEGGSVDVVGLAGETATVTTINLLNNNSRVRVGAGCTLTNFNQENGISEVGCAATSVTAEAGTLTTVGSGAIGTLVNNGATVLPESSGTITNCKANGGTTDFTSCAVARTVTTPTIAKGAKLIYDPGIVTMTTPPAPVSTVGPVTMQLS